MSRRKASTSLGGSDSREGSKADESHLLRGGSASKQAPILPKGQSETGKKTKQAGERERT